MLYKTRRLRSGLKVVRAFTNTPKNKIHLKFPFGWEGGLVETNFQLLMLSSNLLKSKIPMLMGGGGLVETNFELLMLSSNLLKSKIPMLRVGGWGGGVGGNQFRTFDAEFKFAKIQNSHVEGGWVGGGLVETNFQLLMLSSNLLKSKIPMLRVGGEG